MSLNTSAKFHDGVSDVCNLLLIKVSKRTDGVNLNAIRGCCYHFVVKIPQIILGQLICSPFAEHHFKRLFTLFCFGLHRAVVPSSPSNSYAKSRSFSPTLVAVSPTRQASPHLPLGQHSPLTTSQPTGAPPPSPGNGYVEKLSSNIRCDGFHTVIHMKATVNVHMFCFLMQGSGAKPPQCFRLCPSLISSAAGQLYLHLIPSPKK